VLEPEPISETRTGPSVIAARIAATLAAIALAASPGLAAAEPAGGDGIDLGAGLGIGALGMSSGGESRTASGGTFFGHFGGQLTPRLTLLLVGGLTGGDYDEGSATEMFLGGGVRGGLTDRLWLEGAIQTARLLIEPFGFEDEVRLAGARFASAIGYTIYPGQQLDLDAQLGLSFAGYGDDVTSSTMWLAIGIARR
jgi:hypothetical protein